MVRIIWEPQPGPQTKLLECPIEDVLFGGARGGGKTDGMLGDWVSHASEHGQHAKGIFFRREMPQLDDAISRAKELFLPIGAKWEEQKKQFIFPNGAWLRFRPLERDSDAEKYQGQQVTRVYMEELTNYPSSKPVDKMYAILRSAHGVPVAFRATANPGGPGTSWVKQRYIDPAPQGYKILPCMNEDGIELKGFRRVFIPSRIQDNQKLLENDPDYIDRLRMSGPPELVKAWLEGDWSSIEGAAFEKLSRERHMIRPFTPPAHWTRIMGMDWGTAKPFAVVWFCVVEGETKLAAKDGFPDMYLPDGALVAYREYYGWNGKPDEGCRMESHEVALEILQADADEHIDIRVADSAMWAQVDGPSVAENMMSVRWNERRLVLSQAVKNRRDNYQEVRRRVAGIDNRPLFYATSDCTHFWRTVPSLSLDTLNPEKGPDTKQEDHWYDCLSYVCMSRPMITTKKMRHDRDYARYKRETGQSGATHQYSWRRKK